MIVAVVAGADALSKELIARAAVTDPQIRKIVRHYGHMLSTRVKANASTGHHRPGAPHIPGTGPGPNVATGDYRRSIHPEFVHSVVGHYAFVGTNAVQGRRLELGFTGVDSEGRYYDQPPFEHFGPAVTVIEPQFLGALEGVADVDDAR